MALASEKRERHADRLQHRLELESSLNPQLRRNPIFLRDSFEVNGDRVLTLQLFESKPPLNTPYRFSVFDPAGKATQRFELHSPEFTTQYMLETSKIGPDQRMYALDHYRPQGRTTVRVCSFQPEYDDVRQAVIDALHGRRTPPTG